MTRGMLPWICRCLMAKGELDRAVVELDAVAATLGPLSSILMLRAWCDAKSGRMDRARTAYAELEAQSREGKASSDELALLVILVGHESRAPRSSKKPVSERHRC
jgi:hypothetical protein